MNTFCGLCIVSCAFNLDTLTLFSFFNAELEIVIGGVGVVLVGVMDVAGCIILVVVVGGEEGVFVVVVVVVVVTDFSIARLISSSVTLICWKSST